MIYGIDEVGRGCWAGPLVVAAVALSDPIDDLADSKKLSPKQRALLNDKIINDNNSVIISFVSARQVDNLGLSQALAYACEELFLEISKQKYSKVIIDGNINYLASYDNTEAVVKADQSIDECMAASIVAKEARDDYMREISLQHPNYGFDRHVGYGTKQHMEAIENHGLIDEHRRSFKPIKQYVAEERI